MLFYRNTSGVQFSFSNNKSTTRTNRCFCIPIFSLCSSHHYNCSHYTGNLEIYVFMHK